MSRCLILRDKESGLEILWEIGRTLSDVQRTTDFSEDHLAVIDRIALNVPPTVSGFFETANRLLDLLADGLPLDQLQPDARD